MFRIVFAAKANENDANFDKIYDFAVTPDVQVRREQLSAILVENREHARARPPIRVTRRRSAVQKLWAGGQSNGRTSPSVSCAARGGEQLTAPRSIPPVPGYARMYCAIYNIIERVLWCRYCSDPRVYNTRDDGGWELFLSPPARLHPQLITCTRQITQPLMPIYIYIPTIQDSLYIKNSARIYIYIYTYT